MWTDNDVGVPAVFGQELEDAPMWTEPKRTKPNVVPAVLGQGLKVWLIGDSYIRRGEERARHTTGRNLGLDGSVWWFGWGGLRWRNLLPFFHQSLRGRTVPDVLLIHCGGNDLGNIKGVELVTVMKQDLLHLHCIFPEMKIILSSINERCHWRKADPGKINKTRMRSSWSIGASVGLKTHLIRGHSCRCQMH
ncbi:hypothetical protein PFLUV_G00208820 [Perca fluviatilis]|uniref:SGNH hydrolase-type esterase domain-containing protein n=1 Tax=Perca fluviatilis TaxID=8168 RepID=A0A6A5EJZ7_PERFL|nr:hypothetical protein PFLUV_G00208820 [Perca fluviatilis]